MATLVYRYGVRRAAIGGYRDKNAAGYAGCTCGHCDGIPRCLGRDSARWGTRDASGPHPRWNPADQVAAQLRLGHGFREALVDIEHAHEGAMDAMWRTVPDVAVLAAALDAAQQESRELAVQARGEHSADRDAATRPETAAALRNAREREKALRQWRREAIAAALPGRHTEIAALEAARLDVITAARRAAAAGGLYWGCADEATEILTSEGWRSHGDLHTGDAVLTLNTLTGLSEWQPVLAVNRYGADSALMLRMRSRDHSSLTTLNHRWPLCWTDREGVPRKEWRVSGELMVGRRAIKTSAPLADPPAEPKWHDAFVELVAWFFTEGSAENRTGRNHPRVVIHQSRTANPAYVARIRRALTALYGPPVERLGAGGWNARYDRSVPAWREIPPTSPGAHGVTRFRLNNAAASPLLDVAPGRLVGPGFIRELTAAQLELFVQTAIDADGHRRPKGSGMAITQKSPEYLDAVEMAAILAGYTTRRHMWMRGTPRRPAYALHISAKAITLIGSQRKDVVRYTGTVWCPTTPNGTWLARREGTAYYTGNSYNAVLASHQVAVQLVGRRRQAGQPAQLQPHRYDGSGLIAVQLQRESGGVPTETRGRIIEMAAARMRPGAIAAALAEEGHPGYSPGTVAVIVRAIEAGRGVPRRKPPDPPRSPDLIASGAGRWRNVLQLRPWMPPGEFGELPRWRRREIGRTGEAVIAVGGRKTVTVPVTVHRMIPADAEIISAELVITRTAGQWDAALCVTVRIPDPAPAAAGPAVAVHVGWRKRGDGSVRVAVWASPVPLAVPDLLRAVAVPYDGGRRGEIIVPAPWADRAGWAPAVRGIRDALMQACRDGVACWLREQPQEHGPAAAEVARWRSPGRLAALALAWQVRPPRGDGADWAAASLEAWRRRDRHLWEAEAHDRDQLLRRRDDTWRNVAAWLAAAAGRIIADDSDLAALRQRGDDGDEDPALPAAKARKARARAALSAPGRLRQYVIQAAARRGVPVSEVEAAWLTRTCPRGHQAHEADARYARSAVVACPECLTKYDQDMQAAEMMLTRAATP